ncbi:MAG: trypsin-like peptidase domain-containing protein [Anaerolineaceae bacterium]|nr:trypsin-like peptidase domain-containing protein [Anaerolineaceae bacterium]
MPLHSMNLGIQAVKDGHLEDGARLLRIALKSRELTGSLRATALVYLAETKLDREFRLQCYNEALTADSQNPLARQKLAELYNADMMQRGTQPPPTMPGFTEPSINPGDSRPYTGSGTGQFPAAPANYGNASYAGAYRLAGIFGGPNGPGTAFFVEHDGLLATTRYTVGGIEQVTIEMETGRQFLGQVVRAYPEIDLALIQVEHTVNDLMPVSILPRVPEDTPLMVITYSGNSLRGKRRTTRRVLPAHWFPTNIPHEKLTDAGGAPILDDRQYILGMITRNVSSTSDYVYGLHIGTIRKYVESYRQEKSSRQGIYCRSCGSLSRAALAGGYYCETCGGLMPRANQMLRYWNQQSAALYHENQRVSCIHCNTAVGFHKGRCLRCGHDQSRR